MKPINSKILAQGISGFYKSNQIKSFFAHIYQMKQTRCRKHPYPWSVEALARSPFKTRKGVRTQGFTARSSLKSMGRIPRSNGCFVLGDKYKNIFPRK